MRSVIPVVFAGLAAWFVIAPLGGPPAAIASPSVDPALLDPAPERSPNDQPRIDVGGVPLSCNECHKLFESKPGTQRQLIQHAQIVLDHGQNGRCLNCHAEDARNTFELHDGSLVGFDETPRLCSKCHGPAYRDWQEGIHGRSTGSWDTASPDRSRLRCTECHDPHAPAFPGIAPLPGPNTWRMGALIERAQHASASPLQRWLPDEHAEAHAEPHAEPGADDAQAAHEPDPGEHADG